MRKVGGILFLTHGVLYSILVTHVHVLLQFPKLTYNFDTSKQLITA